MAKITRTFRFEEDLIKQFDVAAAALNVDKTKVVTDAIKKFVEGFEMKSFWGTDNYVEVREIFAPIIGRAIVSRGQANLNGELTVIESTLRDFKSQRKDENGTRYDIDNVFATIDFKNKVCRIEYKLFWVGGKIENKEITFPITWNKKSDDIIGIAEITVWEDKQIRIYKNINTGAVLSEKELNELHLREWNDMWNDKRGLADEFETKEEFIEYMKKNDEDYDFVEVEGEN